jgi:hypothetical protein
MAMIKRVNFTGRRRISRECVAIEVYDGAPRTFSAMIDLTDTRMPNGAQVFLEAMCAGSSVITRFDYGRVNAIVEPANRSLAEVEGENVFFALKVVDDSESVGRILGVAENIRPQKAGKQTAAGRQGLLPIDEKPLQQEIWTLEFYEHEVFLIVNKDIPGLKDRARWDPLFFATVYPAVVRMVLTEALNRDATVEDDDDRWPTLWLRFGQRLHPEHSAPPSMGEGDDEWREWVDEVVAAFAERHALRDEYLKALPQLEGDE